MIKGIKSFLFENKTTKQTVAKNTIWLSISNFGGRLLKAIIVIFAARVLGTAGWGVASYALTLAGFLTFFTDPGINSILMRDAAKSPEEEKVTLFSTAFFIKVVFLLIAALIILFAGPRFTTLPGAAELLPLAALIVFFDSMREFFSAFIRARERMEWEAGIFLVTNLAIVIFGFIFMAVTPTPTAFTWAYVAGTLVGSATATIVLWGYIKKVFAHFKASLIAPMLKSAWPFAITGALGMLLTNTDILIISWMRSASEVGIYSAAIRMIQVLYIVPTILQYSTLPILSRFAKNDPEKFRSTLERTIGLVFVASIPLALGGLVLGTQIMTFVFGEAYASGGLALKILMITLLFDYPATIVSAAIFAYDKQKGLIICSAIGGVANVVLDLLLIPSFGIVGSAIATLIAQIASNWYLWNMMKGINTFEVLPRLKKIALSGAIMGVISATLYFLGVHIIVNIIFSAAVYIAALRLLREPLLIEVKRIIFPPRNTEIPAEIA